MGSLWKLCRMCIDSLIIVSFALLPLWISTVNVCPLHSILIFGSVCLGQFNYWEHPPPQSKCILDTVLKHTFHAMNDWVNIAACSSVLRPLPHFWVFCSKQLFLKIKTNIKIKIWTFAFPGTQTQDWVWGQICVRNWQICKKQIRNGRQVKI